MRHILFLLPPLAILCLPRAGTLPASVAMAEFSGEATRTAWFREAKFGLFIHWGPYSQASVEASWPIMISVAQLERVKLAPRAISHEEYVALPKTFNPKQFNARSFTRLAKEAGQRYIVFTTKHHDGFCMFDSQYTRYKITETPYGKDIVAELAQACRDEGIRLGFYYSPPDMHHTGFRDTSKPPTENWQGEPTRPEWFLYLDYMEAQLRELLTRYGEVALIWFDGLGQQSKYDGLRFHKLIHDLQPQTLINNRIGLPGDYATPEQFVPGSIPTKNSSQRLAGTDASVQSPSAAIPSQQDFQLWETCMTINDTWAYNKFDTHYKSATQLIRALVEVASKGGNFLLNVGPTPEGTIQPEFQERLHVIGEWLKVNGESIYGTTYGPLQNLPFGKMTAKGKRLYLHVFDWPQGVLQLDGLPPISAVKILAKGQRLKFEQNQATLRIDVPSEAPDPHVSVLELAKK
ncbi:MAG: alpha-L-fucosidase [Acidobacteriota bacterium]